MHSLRNLGVGKRLGLSFSLVSLLIVVAVAVGQWSLIRQHDINVRMGQLEQVEDDIQTFAYHVADVTGWQGLVVADAGVYGGKAASAPDSMNREGEMESKKALYEAIDATHVEYLTAAEKAQFDKLKPAWDAFFVEDDKIMAQLAEGTLEARTKALENINGGPASDAWAVGLDVSQALKQSLSQRITALEKEAVSVEEGSQRFLYGTLAVALAVAVALSLLGTRSVVRPLGVVVAGLARLAR
ncbi:hypothetical protein, partial [Planobispora takensis]